MFANVICLVLFMKFGVVCIDGPKYVCCSECNVVSNESTSCIVQPIGSHCCEVMYFSCFGYRDELGFLNCDDVCMWVVNKQFELLKYVFITFMLACSMMRFLSLLLYKKEVHDRRKWRRNVVKRKSNPIGKLTINR